MNACNIANKFVMIIFNKEWFYQLEAKLVPILYPPYHLHIPPASIMRSLSSQSDVRNKQMGHHFNILSKG